MNKMKTKLTILFTFVALIISAQPNLTKKTFKFTEGLVPLSQLGTDTITGWRCIDATCDSMYIYILVDGVTDSVQIGGIAGGVSTKINTSTNEIARGGTAANSIESQSNTFISDDSLTLTYSQLKIKFEDYLGTGLVGLFQIRNKDNFNGVGTDYMAYLSNIAVPGSSYFNMQFYDRSDTVPIKFNVSNNNAYLILNSTSTLNKYYTGFNISKSSNFCAMRAKLNDDRFGLVIHDTYGYFGHNNDNLTDTVLKINAADSSVNVKGKINLDEYVNTDEQHGDLWHDTINHALNWKNDVPNTTLQIGEEFRHRVYNNSGATITNGSVVRRTGSYINGTRIPTIALAGTSTYDSAAVYGIATHDISNNSEGYITKHGDVNGLDLSALSDGKAYLGFGGTIIDTMPEPPYWMSEIGEIIYNDNDSGILDVNITNPTFSLTPTLSANFFDSTITVTITTQNVYYPVTNATNSAYNTIDIVGVIFQGDSAQVQIGGQWNINFSGSFAGESVSDTWKFGIMVNGDLKYSSERYTNSTNTGAVPANVGLELNADDWVSFRIVNTTSTRDPTFKNASISMIQLHL